MGKWSALVMLTWFFLFFVCMSAGRKGAQEGWSKMPPPPPLERDGGGPASELAELQMRSNAVTDEVSNKEKLYNFIVTSKSLAH